jgi:hypothetical protein
MPLPAYLSLDFRPVVVDQPNPKPSSLPLFMKFLHRSLAFFVVLAVTSSTHAGEGVAGLPIGAPAPDFSLPGVGGRTNGDDLRAKVLEHLGNHY